MCGRGERGAGPPLVLLGGWGQWPPSSPGLYSTEVIIIIMLQFVHTVHINSRIDKEKEY